MKPCVLPQNRVIPQQRLNGIWALAGESLAIGNGSFGKMEMRRFPARAISNPRMRSYADADEKTSGFAGSVTSKGTLLKINT